MTEAEKNISRELPPEPTLRRLPWYLAYVSTLRQQGVEYVSSTAISKAIDVDSAQIAKDLSVLGLRGKTRIGYEVAALERALDSFLGFSTEHRAVIVGVGSLGAALIADSGLARYGLKIVAGFDIDPAVTGRSIRDVPVLDASRLDDIKSVYRAEIGIITVPVESAQDVADRLVAAGVRTLWNFTPVRLRTAADVVVKNTSLYAHLAVMYNRMKASESRNI
ncbi:MAG: redox-sensing transcriptional repressor Rex [Muribaculaceae bacterium]|nr:redox-sensing transcriptional repressor Rex [Muribaculaceae bacterium]